MYVPNNASVYLRAFAGFMAGITAAASTDTSPSDYSSYARMSDAYAQQLDATWGAPAPTNLELEIIEVASATVWAGRSPLSMDVATLPGSYTQVAAAVIARVLEGNAQVVFEGINPNATGGGGGSTIAPFSSWLWVDQAAPAGGDGSVAAPFNTIAAASAAFLAKGQPSRANKNAIVLVPGIYAENVELYPWIFLVGLDPFATRLTGTVQLWTNPGNANNYWNPADSLNGDLTDMRGALVNLLVTNALTINFNVGATPGSTHAGSNEGKFYLENCICNALFTMIGFSAISQGQARHTTLFAGYTITGATFQTEGTNVTGGGPITVQDNGVNLRANLSCFGGGTNGPIVVTSTAQPALAIMQAFSIQGAGLTLTGAQASYQAGPEGIPPVGSVTLAGGAPPPKLSNDATALAFTPSTLGNWAGTAPAQVSAALDTLAATNVFGVTSTLGAGAPSPASFAPAGTITRIRSGKIRVSAQLSATASLAGVVTLQLFRDLTVITEASVTVSANGDAFKVGCDVIDTLTDEVAHGYSWLCTNAAGGTFTGVASGEYLWANEL
jgi:hypothetical protein